MCALCEAASLQRFAVADKSLSDDFYPLSIAPSELIDRSNVRQTQRITATDGILDYYLHTPGGSVQVSGGGFGEQTIRSVQIAAADQEFFRAMVMRLDAEINLDFREVFTPSEGDVDLYYDTEIDLGDSGQTLGLATTSGEGWELFVNSPSVSGDENYRRYVLIHEFGHALGLEHPFEAGDGDAVNGNTDPWSSSFPEDTVMAYRNPASGRWPEFFTENDLVALKEIWGDETAFVSDQSPTSPSWDLLSVQSDVFEGSSGVDWINGRTGRDNINGKGGSDQLRGGKDGDWLNGNQGNDVILGDLGEDVLRGGRDDDQLNGNAGNDWLYGDRGADVLRGGKDDDWLNGGSGDDQLWGDLGADRIRLSLGNDIVGDFSYADGDRLELASGVGYQLKQVEANLQVITNFGVTTLSGIGLGELQADAIVWV